MHRRAVLALLGTAVGAGCVNLGGPADPPSATPAPVPTDTPTPSEPTPTATGDRPIELADQGSLVEFETLPVTVALASVLVPTRDGGAVALAFDRTATEAHPARLRGTIENPSPEEITFELRGHPLFRDVPTAWPGGRPRDPTYTVRDELVLAPTGAHALATTVPDWALADDGRWRLTDSIDGPWFPDRHRLAPEETVRLEYVLVGRAEGRGFPRARYHFEGYGDRTVVFDVWSTDAPGPSSDSRFEDVGVPPLPNAERMAWYHEADELTPVYLEPSREAGPLPLRVEFTLVNHSHDPAAGNPYFWRLWKLVDGQWFHVAPWSWPVPLTFVPPGGRAGWSLAAFPEHPIETDGAHSVGHLGGGRYAFEVGINRDDLTHAALLALDGAPASLEPTDGLEVTRDGSTVHVTWPRRAEEVPRATLTLTRTGNADAGLITEQVMQRRNAALRNTLAFMTDDIDRVALVTDRNTVSSGARTSGYEDGAFAFEYAGSAYEARAEFDEAYRPGRYGER